MTLEGIYFIISGCRAAICAVYRAKSKGSKAAANKDGKYQKR